MVVIEVCDDSRRQDAGTEEFGGYRPTLMWVLSRVDINFIARGRFLLLRCAQMH